MEPKNTAQLHDASQTDSDTKLGEADVALKFRSELENLGISDEQYPGAIQYAVLYNLRDDLKLVRSQYSWANSIFYFGWLVWQYPPLLMLQRFPVGKFFASQVFGWRVFSFLIATSTNSAGISALRFLLSCAERIQLAAFAIITHMWYIRREQPLRFLCWYAMNGFATIATIAGTLFAHGIRHINSNVPLWKFPFSSVEQSLQLARVKDNQNGVEAKVFKKGQAIEVLKDPKILLNALGSGSGNILGGVSAVRTFLSILLLQSVVPHLSGVLCSVAMSGGRLMTLIIRGFGFSTLQTTLLSLPVGVVQLVMLTFFSVLATCIPNSRLSWALYADGIALGGACMLYAIDPSNRWAVLSGFWLMVGFIPCYFILAFGTMSANIGGHTKKISSQAIYVVCYSVGNTVGPQLYAAPPYRQGLRANVVALAIRAATKIASMIYVRWENANRLRYLDGTGMS
ncbi:major facilitator superfamily domain-containing protein [Dactylonectria macrodidyma]|uniref:Major facilitator superfamily domain-containing protein n=1 Tax=Dactylonectria macrodidyma TaxID=307937 RepID=A0A9P9EYG4_9HYPO|nr:major facilitator superfamily domain-containing protein [Dactylonectria macrodidyma]